MYFQIAVKASAFLWQGKALTPFRKTCVSLWRKQYE